MHSTVLRTLAYKEPTAVFTQGEGVQGEEKGGLESNMENL